MVGPFGPGNDPFALTLWIGDTEIPLILGQDDKGNPLFNQRTAPTISPVINASQDITNRSVPPEQGVDLTIQNVRGGAGSRLYVPGRYSDGDGIDTADGFVRPGPFVQATGTEDESPLDGQIRAVTRHNGRWWIGTEGGKVYYWNYVNGMSGDNSWTEPDSQPDSGGHPVTDLVSMGVAGSSILIAFFDNFSDGPWQYTTDDGDTSWTKNGDYNTGSPIDSPPTAYGKHATVWQDATGLRPQLVWVNDPDLVFTSEDPTDASTFAGPTYVGSETDFNADHFTSITQSASGGDLLVGKKLGWWTVNLTAGTVRLTVPTSADARGIGLENFAWPCVMGGQTYVQIHDFDIVELNGLSTIYNTGFGPFRAGQDLPNGGGVPALQQPVVAMCSDGVEWVYVALGGPWGRVYRFRYQDDGRIHYHGSFATMDFDPDLTPSAWYNLIGNRMFLGSDPLADDTNNYLWICPTTSPYTPYRCILAKSQGDQDVRYQDGATIRFAPDDAGQLQIDKLAVFSIPLTRNLQAIDGNEVVLRYQTEIEGSYNTLNTFTESPEPTDPATGRYPSGIVGKVLGIEAIINLGSPSSNTTPPIIDAIVSRAVRRFPDGGYSEHMDILSFTVDARTGLQTRSGAASRMSAQQIYQTLRDARGALIPPRIVRPFDGQEWMVDILQVTARAIVTGTGPGAGMAIDVVAQQLPISANPINVPPVPLNVGRLFFGNGVPSDGLGSNGDNYTNLDDGSLYSKASGVWHLVSSVDGTVTWDDIPGKPSGFPLVPNPGVPTGLFLRDDGTWAAAGGGGGGTWGSITTGGTPQPLGDSVPLWFDDGSSFGFMFDPTGSGALLAVHSLVVQTPDAPDNALGNDGDVTFYSGQVFAKESGVWTAIVGSTGLTNPVGDDVLLGLGTAGTYGFRYNSTYGTIEPVMPDFGFVFAGGWGLTGNGSTLGLPAVYAVTGDGTTTYLYFQAGGGIQTGTTSPITPYYMQLYDIELGTGLTVAEYAGFFIDVTTITGAGMGATITDAAVMRLKGPPVAGVGMTFTNDPVTLRIDGGDDALRFGTHQGIGAETVTGYITIRDDGGTLRKLAVVS